MKHEILKSWVSPQRFFKCQQNDTRKFTILKTQGTSEGETWKHFCNIRVLGRDHFDVEFNGLHIKTLAALHDWYDVTEFLSDFCFPKK